MRSNHALTILLGALSRTVRTLLHRWLSSSPPPPPPAGRSRSRTPSLILALGVLLTPLTALAQPGQPTGVYTEINYDDMNDDGGKVTVIWQPIYTANYYDVNWREGDSGEFTNTERFSSQGTRITTDGLERQRVTIDELENGKTYQFIVRAVLVRNNVDDQAGSYSDPPVSATPGLPARPGKPELTPTVDTIKVEWEEPGSPDSAEITGYEVRYRQQDSDGEYSGAFTITDTSGRMLRLIDQKHGDIYQFQVRATNKHGDSPWSESAEARVGVPGNDPPTVENRIPNQTVDAGLTKVVSLSGVFSDPDGDALLYTATGPSSVEVRLVGTDALEVRGVTEVNDATITVTADDRMSGTVSTTFEVDVASNPVSLNPIGDQTASSATETVTVTVTAMSTGGAALQYKASETGGLFGSVLMVTPSEYTAMTGTGTVTLTPSPALAGTFSVRVTVRAGGRMATADFDVVYPTSGRPIAPNGLRVRIGDRRLKLQWASGASDDTITHYEYSTDDGATWSEMTGSDRHTTEYIATGLTNGTAYTVKIRAVDAGGAGEATAGMTATPSTSTAPSAPTGLKASANRNEVTLSWDLPPVGFGLTYQYRVDSGTWEDMTSSGEDTTSHTVSEVSSGARRFGLRAVAGASNGAEATVTVVVPGPPSPSLTTVEVESDKVTLRWTDPEDDALTGYEVRRDEGSWSSIANSDEDTVQYEVTGLAPGTTLTIAVRAVNAQGPGQPSEVTVTTGAPLAPAAPTLTPRHERLEVSWTPPTMTGDSVLTGFDVRYRETSATEWEDHSFTSTGTTTSTTIGSLTNDAEYEVQVRATNTQGAGLWSPSATSTVMRMQSLSYAVPDSLTVGTAITDMSPTTVDFTVPPTSYAFTGTLPPGLELDARTGVISGTPTTVKTSTTVVTITATEGSESASYGITFPVVAAGAPAAPAAPMLTDGKGEIEVSWTAPAANGSAITDYDVRYKEDGGTFAEWNAGDDGTTTSATITDLTGGTEYEVQVRATNDVGDSPWSAGAKATPRMGTSLSYTVPASLTAGTTITPMMPRTANFDITPTRYAVSDGLLPTGLVIAEGTGVISGAPTTATASTTAVTITATGGSERARYGITFPAVAAGAPATPAAPALTPENTRIRVSWMAPADNGSAIIDYDVRYKEDGGTFTEWNAADDSTTTSATITGLTNGTRYEVQVRATNGEGDSAWSPSATDTPTSSLALRYTVPVKLAVGTAITSMMPRTANFDTAPTRYAVSMGMLPAGLEIDWMTGVISGTPMTVKTSTTAVTITATGDSGSASYGITFPAVAADAPVTPAAPALTPARTEIEVSWIAPADNGSAITGYDVQYKLDTASEWSDHSFTGTDTSTDITGLTLGRAYQVRVRATNGVGPSDWSPAARDSTTRTFVLRYRAPTSLQVGKPIASMMPTWANAPGDATLRDYRVSEPIEAQPSPNPLPMGLDIDDETGVISGTPETVTTSTTTVIIRAAAGLGGDDTEIAFYSITFPAVTPPPTLSYAPPTSLTVGTAIADLIPTVTYFASMPTSYEVTSTTILPAGLAIDAEIGVISGTPTTEKTSTTAVTIEATAGSETATATITFPAVAAGKPAAPAAPTLERGDEKIKVSWTGAGRQRLGHHRLRRAVQGDNGNHVDRSRIHGNRHQHDDHRSDQRDALRGPGCERPTAWATATGRSAPRRPRRSLRTRPLCRPWIMGTSRLRCPGRRRPPMARPSPTTTCSTRRQRQPRGPITDSREPATSTTITGLTNGTSYEVQVRATNGVGDSAWSLSTEATPAKPPDAPAMPTPDNGDEQIAVTWTAPAANGSAITDYDVQYKETTATTWTDHGFTGTGTSTTITGLTNGTRYEVRVRATNGVGDSDWSFSAMATPAKPPDAPAMPTPDNGDEQIAVTWTAPAANGSAITGYDVRYKETTATTWTDHEFKGTGTSTTITGLTNGTSYEVQVRATNGEGAGAWSPGATATPAKPPDAPAMRPRIMGTSRLR